MVLKLLYDLLMNLTEVQISKFQELYEQKHGKKIGHEDAKSLGGNLVNLFKAILKDNNCLPIK